MNKSYKEDIESQKDTFKDYDFVYFRDMRDLKKMCYKHSEYYIEKDIDIPEEEKALIMDSYWLLYGYKTESGAYGKKFYVFND